jgi:thiamine biosynthesis lipoprotein
VSERRFEAMGCEIVVGGGTSTEQGEVERLFRERDQVFSRFLPGSELNRVNRASGRLVAVSRLFAETLAIALRVAEQTEGLVDPTLGAALEAVGYTRDFALLPMHAGIERPAPAAGPADRGARRSILLIAGWVGVPRGVRLDLNGVVKALAVDDALRGLSGERFVSAGGDLAVSARLNVALPGGETVLLRRGALATSGTVKRRWLHDGTVGHHLIDPRTGLPSTSPWEQVTACGASCLAADVAAKAGFLLGDGGPGWLDRRGIPARFVSADGEVTPNDTWHESMRGALACR